MKHTPLLINRLVPVLLAVALVGTAAAQTEGVAKVVRKKGPARYTTGNNVWHPLEVGTVLKPGTVVQVSTERGAYVDLVLGDGNAPTETASPAVYRPSIPSSYSLSSSSGSTSYQPSAQQNVVRLWENTAVGIDKLTFQQTGADVVTDTQLDLKVGRITGVVKKMSAASKYEVKLPNGVAGIRGTVFDISAEGVIKVLIGSVVAATVDPKTGNVVTQVVMGGQQYDARSGQVTPLPPGDAKDLGKISTEARFVSTVTPITFASDLTVSDVSPHGPHGPPFQPPGPPPWPPGHPPGRP